MADKDRDISAVIRIRDTLDPSDARKSDASRGLDDPRSGGSPPENIFVSDRTGAAEANLPVSSPPIDRPSNNRIPHDDPAWAAEPGPSQASNAPIPSDTSHRDAERPSAPAPAPAGSARLNAEPSPSAARSAQPPPPDRAAAGHAASPRRGNVVVGILAVVSIAAAGISLTAPALRPELVRLSDILFGADNPVTAWLLPPAPPVDVERDLAALIPRVAQLEASLRGVSGDLRRLDSRLAEAGSTLHEGLGSIDSIARMAQDALRRTEGIEAASQDLTNRIRAASLLALATRLRPDVDVGAPLAENALLLGLYGPYPPAVERAIEDLTRMPDGALTMRDLAMGFEALETRIQAATGLDSSWSARGWNRVRSLFGAAPTDLEAALGERLHVLAGEGRFTEAADLLERSPWKELGAAWIGQARDRASAARAAQIVMAHAVAAMRATHGTVPGAAQAATQGAAQGPTQQVARPQSLPQRVPPPPSATAASGRGTP